MRGSTGPPSVPLGWNECRYWEERLERDFRTAVVRERFTLGGIEFEGIGEAKPCYWMDSVVGPGAETWLRGRGFLPAEHPRDADACEPVRGEAPTERVGGATVDR